MVDSQELTNTSYKPENEVASDEEMFANSQDWNKTMELLNGTILAGDACADLATGFQVYELLNSPAPEQSIDLEVHTSPMSVSLDHLRQFPSVEPMILPSVNFQVSLPSETSDKTSWMFSQKLHKLFVKMGNTCTFNVSLLGSIDRNTTVCAMVVCSSPEDRHHPVSRCDNHRCSDNLEIPDYIKQHVVRCKNEQFNYRGTKDGKTYEERLAVLVPMGHASNGGITLEFVCQNSCRNINRRATALVFTLEDEAGRILGRQVFQIKICTNIKRDKLNEEKAVMQESTRKRKATQSYEPKRNKKFMRYHSGALHHSQQSSGDVQIKEESGSRRSDIDPVMLQIPIPSRFVNRVADYAIGQISSAVVRSSNETKRNELMQLIQEIRRIKSSYGLPNSQSSVDSD